MAMLAILYFLFPSSMTKLELALLSACAVLWFVIGIMCVVMGITMVQANRTTTALNELRMATELRFGQVDQDLRAIGHCVHANHELNRKKP